MGIAGAGLCRPTCMANMVLTVWSLVGNPAVMNETNAVRPFALQCATLELNLADIVSTVRFHGLCRLFVA